MSMFSKGDKVRCIQTWTTHVIDRGGEYTVDDVRPDNVADVMEALVRGDWVPFSYFEKVVEPEWVVGQQVSGSDYERLPVGSVVKHPDGPVRTKVSENQWRPDAAHLLTISNRTMVSPRTITYLPEHAEPEDATDAYVEPEPLKEGDPNAVTINTLDREEIHRLIRALPFEWGLVDNHGSTLSSVIDQVQHALREFANPKPARCTSLYDSGAGHLMRCQGEAGHEAKHVVGWVAWTDAEAYGRVEVSS